MVDANNIARFALAVSVAIIVMMIGLSIADDAIGQSTGTQTVTNETATALYNESVDLDGYDLVSGTVTVYGFNDTSSSYEVATAGTDYSVNLGPGTIEANSSSTLIQDGETVKASYDYVAADALTTFIVGFIPVMMGVLAFVAVAGPITRMS